MIEFQTGHVALLDAQRGQRLEPIGTNLERRGAASRCSHSAVPWSAGT